MAVGNRYNGGGPLAGVVIEGQVDASGAVSTVPGSSSTTPTYAAAAQGVIASGPITLAAGVAQTLIGAFPDRRGMRILNYTASPVYLSNGTTGTPVSGGGSDYIPAAAGGVPGQFEFPYAPVNGVRGVSAAAGDLTVTVW